MSNTPRLRREQSPVEGASIVAYSGSCHCPGELLERGQHFPECTDTTWTEDADQLLDAGQDDGWPGAEQEQAYNAHTDAVEALARAGYPSGTLRLQLALALSNARQADWPQPEITTLVEALRAALIAEYIVKAAARNSELPVGEDFAAAAVTAAEPWVKAALLGDAFDPFSR